MGHSITALIEKLLEQLKSVSEIKRQILSGGKDLCRDESENAMKIYPMTSQS